MIIEFELKGSKMLHKGVFDTTGFWVKFDFDYEYDWCDISKDVATYKIYSHFSFTFEHVDKEIAKSVFDGLCKALAGYDFVLNEIGFIREVV